MYDFNFLRGLAPGILDGFSIGRYEKKRESFDLFAAVIFAKFIGTALIPANPRDYQ